MLGRERIQLAAPQMEAATTVRALAATEGAARVAALVRVANEGATAVVVEGVEVATVVVAMD